MAKKKDDNGKKRETRQERQERLKARTEHDVSRREERRVVGLEGQLEAATADWE